MHKINILSYNFFVIQDIKHFSNLIFFLLLVNFEEKALLHKVKYHRSKDMTDNDEETQFNEQ